MTETDMLIQKEADQIMKMKVKTKEQADFLIKKFEKRVPGKGEALRIELRKRLMVKK